MDSFPLVAPSIIAQINAGHVPQFWACNIRQRLPGMTHVPRAFHLIKLYQGTPTLVVFHSRADLDWFVTEKCGIAEYDAEQTDEDALTQALRQMPRMPSLHKGEGVRSSHCLGILIVDKYGNQEYKQLVTEDELEAIAEQEGASVEFDTPFTGGLEFDGGEEDESAR